MFFGLSAIAAKVLFVVLGVTAMAFVVSTIVVAVQKTDLEDELDKCLADLPTTTVTPTTLLPTTPIIPPPLTTLAPEIQYRLPANVEPELYDLILQPQLDNGIFIGENVITVKILENTKQIILHSNGLTISNVDVSEETALRRRIIGSSFSLDLVREFLIIDTVEVLNKDQRYVVKIDFNGVMLGKIVGLYSSSYTKADGSKKWIATSKFEPTYARQAFPCFDEPAMKAKFKVTLYYPKTDDYHALSNMDLVETKDVDESTSMAVFRESVPMSTYLACFIVSDFKYEQKPIRAAVGADFTMQVYATPEQLEKVTFALDTGVGVTEYFIEYFQIEYPLPKLDMVAIPDFVSGAMEHWGLVTFRETALLYHKDISSAINKQRVGSVVAHELAHMWFGNLVTMKWWNDLWLNEGFATYITYKGLHQVLPDWGMLDQFLTSDLHGVLTVDATLASHPIVQTVESPDEITELFDTITYSKGASIIRMLEGFVGEQTFKQGVTNYLNKFSFGSAITDDFLIEVDALSDLDVKHIMETFTLQMGFPVVEVQKISNTEYKLTQKRFFSNPADEGEKHDDSPFGYRWIIPITYITNDDTTGKLVWFSNNDNELTISGLPATTQWVKFNKDQVGYYRVNYEDAVWQNLAAQLLENINVMSVSDRGHLLNDVSALAAATQLSYSVALDFMAYLSKEDEFVPWSVASSTLLTLRNRLRHVDYYQKYMKFAQSLIAESADKVGWVPDEDHHLQNRLRIVILETACALGYQPCVNEAVKRFNEWILDPTNRPDPDIRTIIYSHGVAAIEDEDVWDKVWVLFLDEADANEKAKLMSALATVKLPFILKKFIDLAWDEKNVRSQDYFTCIQSIAANPMGESLVWDYVRENWQRLVGRFGLNERYLGRMIPSITGRFAAQIKLEEMQTFFDKYEEAGAGAAARKQAIEAVRNNIQWLEGNKDNIGEWLANRQQ